MAFFETNSLRRGGPLGPPAQENITVGFCGDVCLAVNALPLARWMHLVRAEVAGYYEATPVDIGMVSSLKQILCVGEGRCALPRVTDVPCRCDLESLRIRLRGGCIPCVPMPPGVTKRLTCFWFGWARRYRLLAKWVDHPRWWLFATRYAIVKLTILDGARPTSRQM